MSSGRVIASFISPGAPAPVAISTTRDRTRSRTPSGESWIAGRRDPRRCPSGRQGEAAPRRRDGDRCEMSGGISGAREKRAILRRQARFMHLQHARPCGRLAQQRLERANHARDEGREALFGRLACPFDGLLDVSSSQTSRRRDRRGPPYGSPRKAASSGSALSACPSFASAAAITPMAVRTPGRAGHRLLGALHGLRVLATNRVQQPEIQPTRARSRDRAPRPCGPHRALHPSVRHLEADSARMMPPHLAQRVLFDHARQLQRASSARPVANRKNVPYHCRRCGDSGSRATASRKRRSASLQS